VGDLLLELGAIERIDADRVVHELMVPGTATTSRIRDQFGTDVIAANGGVDRARLGAIVFGSTEALRQLEAIVHPAVRAEIRRRVERRRSVSGVIVIDAVKLLQSELLELADAVWVVTCSREAELARLVEVRGLSGEAAAARLAAMPFFSHPRVTTVLDNSGSRDDLKSAVRCAWDRLLQEWQLAPSASH
jgi:dephospho-CoA kinase